MAVKVLAISASPRKDGNSDVLCEQFLKGASEVGNEVEKISLRQMNITPCIACYGCSKSHKCVKEDDMHNILQKLIGADVIVLATPVYFYSMDAQMKTMIDRCLPRYQEIRDKDFHLIRTVEGDGSPLKLEQGISMLLFKCVFDGEEPPYPQVKIFIQNQPVFVPLRKD